MIVTRRCVVSGRVQGVFFRATTRDQALSLGLDGYARNLPDGRVEVLMRGEERGVEALGDWLWRGPQMARVERVECEVSNEVPAPGFRTA